MILHILAGGPESETPNLNSYNNEKVKWIGVDRGVITLLNQGIQPTAGFGDFDSVSDAEWHYIKSKLDKVNRFKPEKDETDMELAINWALEQQPDVIRIFGATGGRIDHFMGNLQLLMKEETLGLGVHIEIIDNKNIVFFRLPGEYLLNLDHQKRYVSFIPMTDKVENITLKGFKYPLNNRHIFRGSTLCISNELIQSYGTFSFSSGILMVIRSQD